MNSTSLKQITPVVLTFNEEVNLRRTLDSLHWAERIVVLDSGSTDQTEAIARSYSGVDWRTRPFDNFRSQWEHTFHQTDITTEYVLALDADMEVSPAQIRIVRRGEVKVTQLNHGHKFEVGGPVYRFRNRLIHDDRKSLERWIESQLRYQKENEAELANGHRGRARDYARRMGLMPPIIGVLAYLRAGGPFKGAAAARYAYERMTSEGILAVRLMDARLRRQQNAVGSRQ